LAPSVNDVKFWGWEKRHEYRIVCENRRNSAIFGAGLAGEKSKGVLAFRFI
jgi:hypothetical protein